jgi:hypothetical protein
VLEELTTRMPDMFQMSQAGAHALLSCCQQPTSKGTVCLQHHLAHAQQVHQIQGFKPT